MALDYRKQVYRLDRPETRLRTSYGIMSEWLRNYRTKGRVHRTYLAPNHLPQAQGNFPAMVTRKRPRIESLDYFRQGVAPSEPWLGQARGAALDSTVPMHMRYSEDCGYDDYHNAYRAAVHHSPPQGFPIFGPPRLRHGRMGGSWRHVKEVLQAGGSRIVFVDGRTGLDDTHQIDMVPGGDLILPDLRRQYLNPAVDSNHNLYELSQKTPLSVRPDPHFRQITAQKGIEKENWAIIR